MDEKEKHICARCAAKEKGCMDCCTEPFLDEDSGFFLTFSDIIRISRHTGLAPEDFCSINMIDEARLKENPEDYSEELHYDGHWIGMKGDKKCMFLGKEGCTIFEARPMICRIHPFWFEKEGDSIKTTLDRSPGPDHRLCIVEDKIGCDKRIAELLSGSMDYVHSDIMRFVIESELHRKYMPLLKTHSLSYVINLIEQENKATIKLEKPVLAVSPNPACLSQS